MKKLVCSILAVSFALAPLSALAKDNKTNKTLSGVSTCQNRQGGAETAELTTKTWESIKEAAKEVSKAKALPSEEVKFHQEVVKYASKHIEVIKELNKAKECEESIALEEYEKKLDELSTNEMNKVYDAYEDIVTQQDPMAVRYELYYNLLHEESLNDQQLWKEAQGSEDPFGAYCELRRAYEEDPTNSLLRLINLYREELNIDERNDGLNNLEK